MDPNKIAKQYYCEKCNRTMAADQFYSSNNLEKYPNDSELYRLYGQTLSDE